jgi:hypothetical protein
VYIRVGVENDLQLTGMLDFEGTETLGNLILNLLCKGGVTRESKLPRVLSRASIDDVYT